MGRPSPPRTLVLHAVRILGFADTLAIADRFGLGLHETEDALRSAHKQQWVTYAEFGHTKGWSLTSAGQCEEERLLAEEVNTLGCRSQIAAAYRDFLPLNDMLLQACTDWQLRPTSHDPMAANDHQDPVWDAGVVHELTLLNSALAAIIARLASVLPRFSGYDTRFSTALAHVNDGELVWVDRTEVDSCHRIWFELHEDLLATLGIDRGEEPAAG